MVNRACEDVQEPIFDSAVLSLTRNQNPQGVAVNAPILNGGYRILVRSFVCLGA